MPRHCCEVDIWTKHIGFPPIFKHACKCNMGLFLDLDLNRFVVNCFVSFDRNFLLAPTRTLYIMMRYYTQQSLQVVVQRTWSMQFRATQSTPWAHSGNTYRSAPTFLDLLLVSILLAPVLNMARHALKVHWLPVGVKLLCTIQTIKATLHFFLAKYGVSHLKGVQPSTG